MRSKIFILLILTANLLVGCAPKYPDISARVTRQELLLPKYYFYNNVIWLSDDQTALTYYSTLKSTFAGESLSIYHLSTNEMIDIPMPLRSSSCEFDWTPFSIAMSPNGNLAFNTECEPPTSPQLLMEYDPKTGELKQLFDYGDTFMTHFSFISPDQVVQENAVGYPMSNELWVISLVSQTKTQILTNFLRASDPTWSPQKKLLAFWGTEKFPENKPKDLYTSEDIARLVKYPWDLYVMDENADHIRKVFPLVTNAKWLEWSPDGTLLAFGGTIDNVEGIWLLDINNPNPVRIFDHSWLFAWSPDGKKIMTIETKFPDEKNNDVPVKAYILAMPECAFSRSCDK